MCKKLNNNSPLKILIVDKSFSNHKHLKEILATVKFNNIPLIIVSTYSVEECKLFIINNPDTALIILGLDYTSTDTKNYKLNLIDYIRNTLQNKTVRIILKSDFTETNSSSTLAMNYDINCFINNININDDTIITSVLTCLRCFQDLSDINESKKGLEQIIKSSSVFFELQSIKKLAFKVLVQLSSIVHLNNNMFTETYSCFMAKKIHSNFRFITGIGKYSSPSSKNNINPKIVNELNETLKTKKNKYLDDHFIIYFNTENNSEYIIYYEIPHMLSSITIDLIEVLCTNISAALNTMYLNNELETTEREIIFTLGEISEARSKETGHHVKRVAEYSKILALRCGLSEKDAEIIRMASPMHDVGKLAIPDSILNKPSKLTNEEFNIMKTHSRIGYDMLKKSNKRLMKAAAIIALEHHEKYNGTGYPYGLAGQDIHLYGRITAIADVFDALDSKRVYKNAWRMEEILKLLKDESGKHFDPELISIFFKNFDEILFIRNKFSDL